VPRVVLGWQLTAAFAHDPDFVTQAEVRFSADPAGGTRVDFAHRDLDRYGEAAESMYAGLGGWKGWDQGLTRYVALATLTAG
jgi:hypothetical protein